jgi:hypothetical protein
VIPVLAWCTHLPCTCVILQLRSGSCCTPQCRSLLCFGVLGQIRCLCHGSGAASLIVWHILCRHLRVLKAVHVWDTTAAPVGLPPAVLAHECWLFLRRYEPAMPLDCETEEPVSSCTAVLAMATGGCLLRQEL